MPDSPNQELRAKWRILAGTTVAMFSGATTLPFATAGMFLQSLQAEFGWQRAAISLGPALYMGGVALTTPIVGYLIDRFDARKLIAFGMLTLVLGFAVLSQMQGRIWIYYAAYATMAFVGNLSGAAALTAIVTRTFRIARGRALGLSMAGAGFSTSIGAPLTFLLVRSLGWRTGFLIIGAFILAMTPVVWSLLHPAGEGAKSARAAVVEGFSFREALMRPLYWAMMVAFFFISLGTTGLLVHFVPLLIDKGMAPGTAAAVASGIGISTICARLISGYLVDRWDARWVSAIAMLLAASGFFVFLYGGTRFAVPGALAVGVSFGSETDLVGFMVARYFGMKSYGRLFGIIYGVVLSGAVFSPILYGAAKDAYGSYDSMLGAAIGLLVASAVILAMLPTPARLIMHRGGRHLDPPGVPVATVATEA